MYGVTNLGFPPGQPLRCLSGAPLLPSFQRRRFYLFIPVLQLRMRKGLVVTNVIIKKEVDEVGLFRWVENNFQNDSDVEDHNRFASYLNPSE
jgi:hypothetical protein